MIVLMLGLALADQVDTEPETCLIEYYDAEHCTVCSASYEGDEECQALGSAGKERACVSQGGSNWTEIWCDPGYTAPISGPEVDGEDDESGKGGEEDGCGCGSSAGGGAAAAGLLLTLGLARRRRDT